MSPTTPSSTSLCPLCGTLTPSFPYKLAYSLDLCRNFQLTLNCYVFFLRFVQDPSLLLNGHLHLRSLEPRKPLKVQKNLTETSSSLWFYINLLNCLSCSLWWQQEVSSIRVVDLMYPYILSDDTTEYVSDPSLRSLGLRSPSRYWVCSFYILFSSRNT